MTKRLNISFDSDLLETIASDFDLRAPNKEALRKLIFELDGGYDPEVMQVLNLATGVGKTYLMAAFVEYLRRQGVGNVVIVTPGKTVQQKTIANFSSGKRYIVGAEVPPDVVTPQDYSAWATRQNAGNDMAHGRAVPMLAFIFNIQQLIAPKDTEGETHGDGVQAQRRKPRRFDENAGVLFDYLKGLDDLVVIADESHLYSVSAEAFHAALRELDPAAMIGLTASVKPGDHVIYEYPLYRAIQDEYVKSPVLAFRKSGYGEDAASEEQQLRDALQLRDQKQAFYDAYAEANGLPHMEAVAFVVCADTSHADQVTDLLRSPEFLKSQLAVLQVDSNHDDEITQRMLDNLDSSASPVKVVVSVNKLKEGWDVKNIAVVVTLRAMASEVLTQQTMGRGLRLPFGKYTGILQIDQLDIISHRSFEELLKAENVLEQFGLEESITKPNIEKLRETIAQMDEQTTPPVPTSGQTVNPYARPEVSVIPATSANPNVGIGIRTIEETENTSQNSVEPPNPELKIIRRNPRFAEVTYHFPCTSIQLSQPHIDLGQIDSRELEKAAGRVTDTGDVLIRKEIVTAAGSKLKAIDTESAEVESIHISKDEAKQVLLELVIRFGEVESTQENVRLVRNYIVPRFMDSVRLEHWTVKALASAEQELRTAVRDFVAEELKRQKSVTTIHPRLLPAGDSLTLPFSSVVSEPINNRSEFVRGKYYGGWRKSLFDAESFDSYSGEYALARLLETSPHIIWWHRLHIQDRAKIAYTPHNNYIPDFVALDDQGVHWIIEGKDERGRENETVQAKRKAAESALVRMRALAEYEGQTWGYLVAYEDDTASADSWDDLKVKAKPITN